MPHPRAVLVAGLAAASLITVTAYGASPTTPPTTPSGPSAPAPAMPSTPTPGAPSSTYPSPSSPSSPAPSAPTGQKPSAAEETFAGKITELTATMVKVQGDAGGPTKSFQLGTVKADPSWRVGDHVVVKYDTKTNVIASLIKD